MREEKILSIREVCLDIVALMVAVFVKEDMEVVFDSSLVIRNLVWVDLDSHLIPNIHELFKFYRTCIFEV